MELKELTGNHILKGIEVGIMSKDFGWGVQDDCNYIKFALDDATYLAIEDPDDGYRSYMAELEITEEPCKIKLPDISVTCHMRENDRYDEHDILVFIDSMSGKEILAVGTACVDDYYPYCVLEYYPENMHCNAGEV